MRNLRQNDKLVIQFRAAVNHYCNGHKSAKTKWIEILRSQVNKTTFRNPCNVAPVSREVGVVKRILMIHSVRMVRKTARTK